MTNATTNQVNKAYSSPAWWYDFRGIMILKLSYRSSLTSQVLFFEKNLSAKHLEVAIGSGSQFALVLWWHKQKGCPVPRVVGIDYAERMLAGARKRFRDRENIELHFCDVADLPFSDDSFRSVNVANALHAFPDPDAGLDDIYRVLASGGSLAANVMLYPKGWGPIRWLSACINRWCIRKGILKAPFHLKEIRGKLLAHGFEITEEWTAGNTYFVVARKPLAELAGPAASVLPETV